MYALRRAFRVVKLKERMVVGLRVSEFMYEVYKRRQTTPTKKQAQDRKKCVCSIHRRILRSHIYRGPILCVPRWYAKSISVAVLYAYCLQETLELPGGKQWTGFLYHSCQFFQAYEALVQIRNNSILQTCMFILTNNVFRSLV